VRPNEPRHWTWPTLDEAVHHIAMAAGTVLWAAAAWAFLSGPSRHAEAEQRVAVEVEAENEGARRASSERRDRGGRGGRSHGWGAGTSAGMKTAAKSRRANSAVAVSNGAKSTLPGDGLCRPASLAATAGHRSKP
jgi:hypothetical protein